MRLPGKEYRVICLFLLPLLFIAASCSQAVPEVRYVSACLIADYQSAGKNPDVRLSLFVESAGDPLRFSCIEAVSADGYRWTVNSPSAAGGKDRKWAGCANLRVPDGMDFPRGSYIVRCENADGEETLTSFSLDYDGRFLDAAADTVPVLMDEMNGRRNVAVFGRDGILIYYGKAEDALSSPAGIKGKFGRAGFFRSVWTTSDGNMVCLMPPENL